MPPPATGGLAPAAGRHEDAVPVLEKYVGWVPDDKEVKRALASSYRATGQMTRPSHREGSRRCARRRRSARRRTGAASQMNAAIALYNQKKYAEAAAAFEQVLAVEPNNRDALYGLSNAYIGLKSPKLADAAGRLVGIEPLNDDAFGCWPTANGWPRRKPLANKTAIQVLAMPISRQSDPVCSHRRGR